MWSAVLGLAGSAFGALQQSQIAREQMVQQQYQLQKQMEMQELQLGMARDAQRQLAENNAYDRQIEKVNRLTAQQERNFQIQGASEMRNQLTEERRQMIARQVTEDREAAQQKQFQLEQLLDNQRLSANERDFALAQLKEAKAIASGERDADLRRFHEEREMAKNERDFVIGEYQNYKSKMDLERQQELDIRNQTLNQIYGLQDALTGVQSQLGTVPEIQQITEADIAREIERRTTQNISDVDRAATAVASVGEADLIRNGIDLSSTGSARRADIAGQLAAEYQTARARAYNDAMSYITGKSQAMSQNVGNIIDRRGAILRETADVHGAGVDMLQNRRQLPSAADAYRMASSMPSAIYNRNISSANDFRAPVSINSAIYDRINVGPSLAQFRTPSSAAMNISSGVGSSILNPYTMGTQNPSTYMNNVSQIGNQLLTNSTNSANNAYNNAYQASVGFGANMRSFIDDNSGSIDSWFDNIFGKNNANKSNQNTGPKTLAQKNTGPR